VQKKKKKRKERSRRKKGEKRRDLFLLRDIAEGLHLPLTTCNEKRGKDPTKNPCRHDVKTKYLKASKPGKKGEVGRSRSFSYAKGKECHPYPCSEKKEGKHLFSYLKRKKRRAPFFERGGGGGIEVKKSRSYDPSFTPARQEERKKRTRGRSLVQSLKEGENRRRACRCRCSRKKGEEKRKRHRGEKERGIMRWTSFQRGRSKGEKTTLTANKEREDKYKRRTLHRAFDLAL